MAGKGDKPRPLSVSYEKYAERYDAIFKKLVKKEITEACEFLDMLPKII